MPPRGIRLDRGLDIAVVGAGLAGLAAAWRLARRHRVKLFERQAAPGFVASSLTLPPEFGGLRVDVPLRVFYPGYYPTLLALYAEIGVATEPVDYATTFTDGSGEPFFRYRNLRWRGNAWAYVLPRDLRTRRARRVLAGALHFHGTAPRALAQGHLAGLTLGEHLQQAGYSPEFVDGLLLPAVATICTCPNSAALAFPAEVVVDYLVRGLTRQAVRRAVHGADDVAERLLQRVPERHFGAALQGLVREPGGVTLVHGDGRRSHHDHVVIAAPAHRALALLGDATAAERRVLGAISHHAVEVVVHRDERLMPAQRRDWSPVNAVVTPEQTQAMSTIWLNAVQPALRDAPPLFQTVAPGAGRQPRDELVLGRAHFERPVVSVASLQALPGLAALHAEAGRRVWFCGSYARAGIPLLEAAVASALAVAERIDAGADTVPATGAARPPVRAAGGAPAITAPTPR